MVLKLWWGTLICICLDFLLICQVGMSCSKKLHPWIMFGVRQMGLQSNCGNIIWMDHQSYLLKSQALFHIAQLGAMMCWGLWRKKRSLMLDYPNMWNFENKALIKIQRMQWKWLYMLNIGRMFCCICQNRYVFKVQHFWRVFGLQAIGGLIMLGLCCQLGWKLLMQKTHSCVLIAG